MVYVPCDRSRPATVSLQTKSGPAFDTWRLQPDSSFVSPSSWSLPVKPGAMPPPRKDKPPMKKVPSPPPPGGPQGRPSKPFAEAGKPPPNTREPGGSGSGGAVRAPPPREQGKAANPREGRPKDKQQRPPRRYVAPHVSVYWKNNFPLASIDRFNWTNIFWPTKEHFFLHSWGVPYPKCKKKKCQYLLSRHHLVTLILVIWVAAETRHVLAKLAFMVSGGWIGLEQKITSKNRITNKVFSCWWWETES